MKLLKSLKQKCRESLSTPLKSAAKGVLLKLLFKLDSTLRYNLKPGALVNPSALGADAAASRDMAANSTESSNQGAASLSESSNPSAMTDRRQCVVFDENASIANGEMLAIAFRAVFDTVEFDDTVQCLWDYLIEDPSRWSDYGRLMSSLTKRLGKLTQTQSSPGTESATRTESSVERAHELMAIVQRHEESTEKNQTAYVADGKSNPNAVFWPDPTLPANGRSLFDELPIAQRIPLVDKQTPVGSAGSCFAMELAHRLQSNGFNYVVTEPAPNQDGLSQSSARWGIMFNTPSLRQLVEKAFGVRRLPRIVWTLKQDGKRTFRDPFREDIVFDSLEEFEANYDAHIEAARSALEQAKIFVVTLGVNEVWRLKGEHAVFSRCPWRIASGAVERRVMTVEENVRELQRMVEVWRHFNPDLKLIVSVSPVPLHATFRGDETHVIAANAHSKATLRVAAEEFVARTDGAYYFPSYETVTHCTANPWQADQRHVSREAVGNVMRLFEAMFVRDQAGFAQDTNAGTAAKAAPPSSSRAA